MKKVNRLLKNVTSEGKLGATGAQLPECIFKYMRIATTQLSVKANIECYAGTNTVCAQVAERSSFSTAC